MRSINSITLVQDKGIVEDERFFDRPNKAAKPSRRQVTLIDREQIAQHAASLGLTRIAPGLVRANIETVGVSLIDWIGKEIEIGTAILFVAEARTPCAKMDVVAPGLRNLMGASRQGVLAQVIRSGVIREGDVVRLLSTQRGVASSQREPE
jgi:MOSC domain-containing protein YiiM